MPKTPSQPDPIPWTQEMRRIIRPSVRALDALLPGETRLTAAGEWMAPDAVVQLVRAHYAEALAWMHDATFTPSESARAAAARFLSGSMYRQFLLTLDPHANTHPPLAGVLRCEHSVRVRYFAPNGARCLVIDSQTERRMATYMLKPRRRLHTQDLGDGVAVYSMLYVLTDRRWKIDAFVQDLPTDFQRPHAQVVEQTPLPKSRGRG